MASITVNTNGQTLTVNASISHWTSAALAVVASGDDDIPSTTTTTITSDYTMHFANTATTAVVTVKQLDGTTLLSQEFQCSPAVGPRTLNPLPTPVQAAADLNPLARGYTSGHYYFCQQGFASSTVAPTLSQLRLVPWPVSAALTVATIGAEVQTAGSAGSVFRIGIYADTGYNYPGALILDAGTIDGESNTVQEINITDLPLTPGMYWVGGAAQVAAPTMRVYTTPVGLENTPLTLGTSAPGAGATIYGFTQASVTGALPATFTSTVTAATAVGTRIFFKAA